MNMLYCFISHQPIVVIDSIKISNMMSQLNYNNFIIVYGGHDLYIKNSKVIYLDCADDYCSLPEKINKTFKYCFNNLNFDFVCKVDRSVDIKQIYPLDTLKNDYSGVVYEFTNGTYHFNRCIKKSKWFNKKFEHEKIPYCAGGLSYILSKNSVQYIANDNNLYRDYIYEDVYIASILRKYNIYPQKFNFNYKEYIFDSDIPWHFK